MITNASKYSSRVNVAFPRRSTNLPLFAYNKPILSSSTPKRSLSSCASLSIFLNNKHHEYNQRTFQYSRHPRITNGRLFSTAADPLAYTMEGEEHENHSNNHVSETSPNNPSGKKLTLQSKPIPGGNWNPDEPLKWCENFGRRDPKYEKDLLLSAQLKDGDEGYFDVSDITVKGVTIVRNKAQAEIVMQRLMSAESEKAIHACDTEVMAISLKDEGPVGNGYVTCLSMYSGPDFDYGLGDGPGTALWVDNLDDSFGVLQYFKEFFEDGRFKTVWHNYGFDRHVMWNEGIDVRGFKGDTMHMARLCDTSRGMLGKGAGYSLEALTADYLGRRKKPMKEIFGVARLRKDGTAGSLIDVPPVEVLQRDPRFRRQWIIYSAYDAEGTWLLRETLEQSLQKMDWVRFMCRCIFYPLSLFFITITISYLRTFTHSKYQGLNLYDYYDMHMRKFAEVLTDMERRGIRVDAKEYLASVEVQAREDRAGHVETFRKWAYKMIGPDGLAINPASSTQLCTFLFGGALNTKTKEETEKVRVFTIPRIEIPDDAMELLKKKSEIEREEEIKRIESEGKTIDDEFDNMKVAQLKALCKENGLKISGKKSDLQERLRGHYLAIGNLSSSEAMDPRDDFDTMPDDDLRHACAARNLDQTGTRKQLLDRLRQDTSYSLELLSATTDRSSDGFRSISEALEAAAQNDGGTLKEILNDLKEKSIAEPKNVDITITSIGMQPEKFTAGGAPSVTADVLRGLAGDPFTDPPKYGKVSFCFIYNSCKHFLPIPLFIPSFRYIIQAYEFFGGGEKGHDACVALYSLTAIGSIDTMIANFLTSLQTLCDHDSRVHGSININTETGRLSSRKPNLQNQPALEKDKYQIRKAFQSSPGNNLIVADYGQLELRLLASMTECTSMIEAFEAGGDFHSRTALGMFGYIQDKVNSGECLLEWDYSKGEPPKPMLKDEFASERRKAKTLNFSIAYGKTAHGLSQDWGVSTQEAEKMLRAWYDSRPEVEKWQIETKAKARKEGITRTLMGRYRMLPDAMGRNRKLIGHAERASINTPIQGGAADVAMMAMNKINESEKLKKLGWILLMQIHDEVILEGPEETSEEAFKEVVKCMQEPWVFGLEKTSVPLLVDGSCNHKNWYEAK